MPTQSILNKSKEEGDDDQDDRQNQISHLPRNNKQNQINLRISCHDQDVPLSLAFSDDSRYLYTITLSGLFCVWDVFNLKRLFVKFFNKVTKGLIVCKLSKSIYIAFENEIFFLNNDIFERKIVMNNIQNQANNNQNPNLKQNAQQIQNSIFDKLIPFNFEDSLSEKFESNISDMKLSKGEAFLAVAIQKQINIYAPVEKKLNICHTIEYLHSIIEYIDFTIDDNFLLYKDSLEEVSIIDLQNKKKINTIFIEHDIEWCSDGIKISEKTKGVLSQYSEDNKILKITQISEDCIAVTDEMGTIRLYNYPCDRGTGNGYMKCYTDHLNNVNQSVLSPDSRFLVTSSERDKCIFIWTIQIYEGEQEYDQNNMNQDGGDQNEYNYMMK